ncbi:unnamed protein product [Lactuca virosa]|uniref:Uncharacterized protein n=1 Tax=Lactuca virosa TaxID=75947 RepID=A0AAU9PWT4_9ASTR|nr:unnamed protein product [Lactuca virosa]
MEESLSKKHIVQQEISGMPSFSLGVSQEDISDEQLNVKSEIKQTINSKLPVVAKLKIEEMENHINHCLRSPYRLIEVETHKRVTCDENIVCDWLFSCKGEPIDEVIKTKRGDTTIRVAMESLLPSFEITAVVLDCWSDHLNYDENAQHANSPSRVFCKVAITVFFPVIRKENTFLVVFNLNSTVYKIIDNVSGTIHEVVYDHLAENLKKMFTMFLKDIQHSSATKCSSESMKLHITDLPWKTVKETNDKGIFAMRHMETYKGKLLRKWNTEIDYNIQNEIEEQKNQIWRKRVGKNSPNKVPQEQRNNSPIELDSSVMKNAETKMQAGKRKRKEITEDDAEIDKDVKSSSAKTFKKKKKFVKKDKEPIDPENQHH